MEESHLIDWSNNNDGTWTFTVHSRSQLRLGYKHITHKFTLTELCLSTLRCILNDELKSDAELINTITWKRAE